MSALSIAILIAWSLIAWSFIGGVIGLLLEMYSTANKSTKEYVLGVLVMPMVSIYFIRTVIRKSTNWLRVKKES